MRSTILLFLFLFIKGVIPTTGVVPPLDLPDLNYKKELDPLIRPLPYYPCYNPSHFNPEYLATMVGHMRQEAGALPLNQFIPYYEKYFGHGMVHKDMNFYMDCPRLISFRPQNGSLIYANSRLGYCLRNGHVPTSIVAPEAGIVTKIYVKSGVTYKQGQKMFSYLEIPDCTCQSPKKRYFNPTEIEGNSIIVSDYAKITRTANIDPLQMLESIDFYTLLKPLPTLQLISIFPRSYMTTFYAPEDGTLILSYAKPYIPMIKSINHLYVYRDNYNNLTYAELDFPLLPCDFSMKSGDKLKRTNPSSTTCILLNLLQNLQLTLQRYMLVPISTLMRIYSAD